MLQFINNSTSICFLFFSCSAACSEQYVCMIDFQRLRTPVRFLRQLVNILLLRSLAYLSLTSEEFPHLGQ